MVCLWGYALLFSSSFMSFWQTSILCGFILSDRLHGPSSFFIYLFIYIKLRVAASLWKKLPIFSPFYCYGVCAILSFYCCIQMLSFLCLRLFLLSFVLGFSFHVVIFFFWQNFEQFWISVIVFVYGFLLVSSVFQSLLHRPGRHCREVIQKLRSWSMERLSKLSLIKTIIFFMSSWDISGSFFKVSLWSLMYRCILYIYTYIYIIYTYTYTYISIYTV